SRVRVQAQQVGIGPDRIGGDLPQVQAAQPPEVRIEWARIWPDPDPAAVQPAGSDLPSQVGAWTSTRDRTQVQAWRSDQPWGRDPTSPDPDHDQRRTPDRPGRSGRGSRSTPGRSGRGPGLDVSTRTR